MKIIPIILLAFWLFFPNGQPVRYTPEIARLLEASLAAWQGAETDTDRVLTCIPKELEKVEAIRKRLRYDRYRRR